MSSARLLLSLAALAAVLNAGIAGTSARDQQRDAPLSVPPRSGSAALSGVVLGDDGQNQPLRRVTITLTETSALTTPRKTATDDNGRFVFRNIPAGRYLLTGAKGGYLTTAYGSKGAPRASSASAGTAVVVADGQQIAELTIRLARGGVITGRITDAGGKPSASTQVTLGYYARSPITGERTFSVTNATSGMTDDRGIYRIFGIAPGDYVVMASPPMSSSGELLPTTDADLDRARSVLSGRVPAPPPASAPRHVTVAPSQVYFPGTVVVTDAAPIPIAVGEERTGVDFQLQFVPTARVEGTLLDPNGQPMPNATVQLVSARPPISLGGTTATNAAGSFLFLGVRPSTYAIVTSASPPGVAVRPDERPFYGIAEVEVRGEDVKMDVRLQRGVNVSGRVVVEATVMSPPSDFSRARVLLTPTQASVALGPRSVTLNPDGSFNAAGFAPGRYRVTVTPAAAPSQPTLYLKSALFNGQDAVDSTFEILPGQDIANATLTLTQQSADISGKMMNATGTPTPEYFVIAYSADSAFWAPMSRRIQQTRPARDGSYVFRNLPPGDYLIAAVTDVDQGQWFDGDYLRQLVAASLKVTLAEGEKKIQDIRVK